MDLPVAFLLAASDTLANLTTLRDLYFLCLLVCSGVVAIGVALEGPEVIHEARKVFGHIGKPAPPWVTLLALIGWVMVACGVIGEATSEALVSHVDTSIQALNDRRLADTTREAGDATQSAIDASKAASSATSSAMSARREANDATRLAKTAQREAISSLKASQQITQALAESRRELANLQSDIKQVGNKASQAFTKVMWRDLDCKAFTGVLVMRPAARLLIEFQPNESESYSFEQSIKRCLEGADLGWTVSGPIPVPEDAVSGLPLNAKMLTFGLTIESSSCWIRVAQVGMLGPCASEVKDAPTPLDSAAGSLLTAFFAAKVMATPRWNPTLPLDEIIVLIGPELKMPDPQISMPKP